MESHSGFEELLRKSMRADEEEPSLSLVEEARRQVALRKRKTESGVFVLPRWLFNFRISFYHALLLVLLLETGAIYQTHRSGTGHGRESMSAVQGGDVSAALSSTILPGTTTYLRQ